MSRKKGAAARTAELAEVVVETRSSDDLLVAFRAIVSGALAGVDTKYLGLANVRLGEGGLPHRLTLPHNMPGLGLADGECVWSFFDDTELRRLMLAIARRVLAALEQRADDLVELGGKAQGAVETQAAALGELEASL